MNIGICKLCQQEKPLVGKSHIVPKFMLGRIKQLEGGELYTVKVDKQTVGGKKVQDGLYESDILCEDCDNKVIGQYEDYARRLLYGGKGYDVSHVKMVKQLHSDKKLKSLKCDGVDYKKFKLFLLSLLWRASVSSRDDFQSVYLGREYEEEMRRMLLNGDPGKADKFPCLISSITAMKDLAEQIISPPIRTRQGPSTVYTWQIGQLLLHYFVSKSHVPQFIFEAVLSEDGVMAILDMNDEMSRLVLGKIVPHGEQMINHFYKTKLDATP